MRRTLIIAAGAIVIIGVAVGIYFYFFAGTSGIAVSPSGGAGLPTAGDNGSGGTTGTGRRRHLSTRYPEQGYEPPGAHR